MFALWFCYGETKGLIHEDAPLGERSHFISWHFFFVFTLIDMKRIFFAVFDLKLLAFCFCRFSESCPVSSDFGEGPYFRLLCKKGCRYGCWRLPCWFRWHWERVWTVNGIVSWDSSGWEQAKMGIHSESVWDLKCPICVDNSCGRTCGAFSICQPIFPS